MTEILKIPNRDFSLLRQSENQNLGAYGNSKKQCMKKSPEINKIKY